MENKKEHQLHDAFVKREKHITDKIAKFAGNMKFVYTHTLVFLIWIIWNAVGDHPFDAYPFIFLTFVVSLEAIFLSTFVLINQNKDTERSEKRAQLDLQIDRRAEKEIQELKRMLTDIQKSIKK